MSAATQIIASLTPLRKTVYDIITTSTSNQNWPVPNDFNIADNTIEVGSPGGDGGLDGVADGGCSGGAGGIGGGGGYAKKNNVALTPGGVMVFHLPPHGAAVGGFGGGVAGAWANGATQETSSAGINSGNNASNGENGSSDGEGGCSGGGAGSNGAAATTAGATGDTKVGGTGSSPPAQVSAMGAYGNGGAANNGGQPGIIRVTNNAVHGV